MNLNKLCWVQCLNYFVAYFWTPKIKLNSLFFNFSLWKLFCTFFYCPLFFFSAWVCGSAAGLADWLGRQSVRPASVALRLLALIALRLLWWRWCWWYRAGGADAGGILVPRVVLLSPALAMRLTLLWLFTGARDKLAHSCVKGNTVTWPKTAWH